MDPLNPERLETRIKKLRLDEVSGVDEPANLTPGWLLTKSATGGADASSHAVAPSEVASAIRAGLREELAPVVQALTALNRRLDAIEGR